MSFFDRKRWIDSRFKTQDSRRKTQDSRCKVAIVLICALCLVSWGLCPVSAWGQETLSLQESIDMAMAENLSMKAAQEKVSTAEQKTKEAIAAMLPSLSASGSYTYFGKLPTMIFDIDPSMFGLPSDLLESMGGGAQAQDSAPNEIPVGQEDTYKAGLALQQPIFMWGKLYNNYKQAKLNLEAAKQELEAVRQQVILDVTTSFYGILLTEQLVKVAEMAVEQVQAHVKTAQDLVDAGMATNFDLLRAKVQLANIKSQFIRARNGLELSKDSFKNIIGMELGAQVSVQGELVYQPVELDLDELLTSAMENRPEIKQLRFQEQAGRKLVSLAKAGSKPNLVFVANHDWESYADTPGDVFDRDEWKRSWNLTLALNVPIFDGLATRARVKQAESGLRQIQIGMDQLMDGIGLEVRAAYLSFQESQELLNAQEEAVQQAEERLRIANLRYGNGMITTVELMDAELAFTQAQTNRFNALYDYTVALAKLEKASASGLEKWVK
jgi:outer membrane protein